MSMSQPLSECLPQVAAQIVEAPHVLLLLDYDGTLAPIVEQPEDARMPAATRAVLADLARDPRITTVLVSGRALQDLRGRVGLQGAVYIGNHGMEIEGRGLSYVEPIAASCRSAIRVLCRTLAGRLSGMPGASVEDKGLTASIHYRRVATDQVPHVGQVVEAAVACLRPLFRVTAGHKVYEVRPTVHWNKGMAVRWVRERIGIDRALPIYLGDDATDEDAFRALPDGVTIRVGDPSKTSARYHLRGPPEVQAFLAWLTEVRGGY